MLSEGRTERGWIGIMSTRSVERRAERGWNVDLMTKRSKEGKREFRCLCSAWLLYSPIPLYYCNHDSNAQSPFYILLSSKTYYFRFFLYNSPPQSSLNLFAACSGVISLCGSAINSYPTRNFLTVALLNNGG